MTFYRDMLFILHFPLPLFGASQSSLNWMSYYSHNISSVRSLAAQIWYWWPFQKDLSDLITAKFSCAYNWYYFKSVFGGSSTSTRFFLFFSRASRLDSFCRKRNWHLYWSKTLIFCQLQTRRCTENHETSCNVCSFRLMFVRWTIFLNKFDWLIISPIIDASKWRLRTVIKKSFPNEY